MTFNGWLQIAIYAVLVVLITKPFGGYMTRVFDGERTPLSSGAASDRGRHLQAVRRRRGRGAALGELRRSRCWRSASPASSSCTRIQRLQNVLPFNPQGQDAVSPDLAFNTSVSFMTNTNWQSYVPETTMSYLTQMAGAHGAQLRLGRHRHRARHRADPRLRAAFGTHASATSGSI